MKHDDPRIRSLTHMLDEVGLKDVGSLEDMLRHLDWVLETNTRINLTRITDPDEALRLHVVDSLVALPEIEQAQPGPLLDLGSGGGFPGVPLGLATGRETMLDDSVAKKMTALQGFIDSVGWSGRFRTSTLRAEELALSCAGCWAVISARAITQLPSLVELAAPLLRPGGSLVALKGAIEEDEMSRGVAVAELVGLKLTNQRFLSLPNGGEKRSVFVFERVREPKIALPRRVGLAQKKPLA